MRQKKERGSDKARTCLHPLHLSTVTTHNHQQPSLELSASVLLSVDGDLGMDGWSREEEADKMK